MESHSERRLEWSRRLISTVGELLLWHNPHIVEHK